jgi:hypothetical protein
MTDRRATIRSVLKVVYFLAHEKTRTVWGIFLYHLTQPAQKQGIKIFLRPKIKYCLFAVADRPT